MKLIGGCYQVCWNQKYQNRKWEIKMENYNSILYIKFWEENKLYGVLEAYNTLMKNIHQVDQP